MDTVWTTVLMVASAITAIAAAIFAVDKLTKPLRTRISNLIQSTEQFVRDWSGEPAAPGRAAVPGVMERLNRIDGELSKNSGKSIKDTVNRIEKRLIEGDKKFNDLYSRLEDIERERVQ